jgi:16S rRNA (guanine966-N2)-methyltransferase
MRIIAGALKGRVIRTLKLKDGKVRPTTTKVREALFSILYSAKNFDEMDNILQNSIVLDLCCGSGALGIEALSRGAKFCYFIDYDAQILSRLAENLSLFKQTENTKLIRADVKDLPRSREKCNLIFIDPPYQLFPIDKIIKNLEQQGWIDRQAIIVVENYFQEDLKLNLEHFTIVTERIYGKAKLTFVQKNDLQ